MVMNRSHIPGPLDRITVLDLTHVLSGPYCTMLLADLGARVIKVEGPGHEDVARQLGPFIKGRSTYFATINRGKEGIMLDLKEEGDRALFERLISHTDVLVENFTPGTMDRLDLGWDDLHPKYPHLIYAAISGFGRTGPLSHRKSNDLIAQAMGGIMSLTGPEGGPPTRVGTSMADMASGVFATVGICAALFDRERSGEGTLIDISMVDCQISLLEHNIARYFTSGISPTPIGNRHPSVAPFGAYETADGQIIVSTAIDKDFKVLADLLGRSDLPKDPRFIAMHNRAVNCAALDAEICSVLRTHTTTHWLELFESRGLRAAPIQNVEDVINHPQTSARNMLVSVLDPEMGELIMQGNPIKMSCYRDIGTRSPAPAPGEHTKQVKIELDAKP